MMTENGNSLCGTVQSALSAPILGMGILLFYCHCCETGWGKHCAVFSFGKKARLLHVTHIHRSKNVYEENRFPFFGPCNTRHSKVTGWKKIKTHDSSSFTQHKNILLHILEKQGTSAQRVILQKIWLYKS